MARPGGGGDSPPPPPPLTASTASTACDGYICPSKLRSFYNMPASNDGSSAISTAVFESGEDFSPGDLARFQRLFSLPENPVTSFRGNFQGDSTADCDIDPNQCGEANLDVQYLLGLSSKSPLTYWNAAGSETFATWITDVASDRSPPSVISISYGIVETYMSSSIKNTFNLEAMKLGLRGVTILVSSGDDGVAGTPVRYGSCGYVPSFPASSPYVTAVGATQGVEKGATEIACSSATGALITTGGGFSAYYDAPSYQTSAISTYFSRTQAVAGYSATGRGYPDVALAGHNYVIYDGGTLYSDVDGTSASAPVFAAMVTNVKALLAAAGKKPIGFLNPTIYAAGASSFNDITSGNNRCGSSGSSCCSEGFEAAEGWIQ